MEELLINTLAEDEVVTDAKNAVRTIADGLQKSKAYYNVLAAKAVEDYLRGKGLVKGEIFNLHSSAKMLADFEIADIQLPNLYIDVRAVFDENEIFIPKKHFNNNLLPDIYLVLKLNEDLAGGTLLGFVEPSKINKQNQNDEYYFVNKSFLTPVSKLEEFILSAPEKTQYMMTDVTESSVEKLIMLYMDHDLDDSKLEKLIDYLKNSAVAREKLVEFENFERLSYLALKEFKDLDVEKNDFTQYIKGLVTTDEFAEFEHGDELTYLFNDNAAPAASGLFVDDEAEAAEEVKVEQAPESGVEEVYEEAEILSAEEVEEPESEAVEPQLEEDPILEEILDETPVLEEEAVAADEPVLPVDEFEAFEAVDEFGLREEDVETAEAVESVEEPVVEPLETPVEEHELILDSEELTIEAGDVLNIELPQELDVELPEQSVAEESVISETLEIEETSEQPETVEEIMNGEDLEFQVDGLMEIGEEPVLENIELDEVPLEEIHTEITEEVSDLVIEQQEPESDVELNVEETLGMDEVNLDSETVIGLTEGVMVEEVEPVAEAVEPENSDEVPMFDIDGLEGLDLGLEENEPAAVTVEETPDLQSEVETVTDEDVENAIAMSAMEEEAVSEPSFDAVEDISHDSGTENSEFGLDELLSIENDLTAGQHAPAGFKFDDIEDEDEETQTSVMPSEEELAMLSADLDDEDEDGEESENFETGFEEYNFDENQDIPEDGTDFAFAVDQKPVQRNILMPIAALVTVIGLIGAGAWYFLFNGKTSNNDVPFVDETQNPIEDINIDMQDPVTPDNSAKGPVTDIQIPAETTTPQDVKSTSQPEKPAEEAKPAQKPAETKTPEAAPLPEPLTLQKIKKDFSQPNTYLSISKIVWDVPEYLTYNEDFSGYLQTLGSTLKLNLSSDLLLISENTLLNRVKVKVGLKDSGKKFSAELIDGCGTKSVDDLVLQSVKNTLNLLKPPVNSLDTADEDLYITIYL